jgi:LmbE family N-acetylglucosaminyl deacetylase
MRAAKLLQALMDLPITRRADFIGERPLLVLAPHPDDESLGCGGLIADCVAAGQRVHILVITDGSKSHPNSARYPAPRLAALRMEEARAAAVELGLNHEQIDFLGLPDGRAPLSGPGLLATAALIAEHARARGIATICTTWLHDPHHDHLAAHRLGMLVARDIGARLLSYPIWSWTIPPAAWVSATPVRGARIDIARHVPAKRRAIACHRSQTTRFIEDDPTGFVMSPEFLAIFDRPFEVFVEG